jgi:hypothetical protein
MGHVASAAEECPDLSQSTLNAHQNAFHYANPIGPWDAMANASCVAITVSCHRSDSLAALPVLLR